MMECLVSVVIPTRNRADSLRRTLDALSAQSYPHFEIIVVDDASTDDTRELLNAWAGGRREVFHQVLPHGSYAARNRGWRAARGEVIAFTDDDCLPDRDWLSNLTAPLDDASAIASQGMTVASPGEITPFTHQIEQRRGGPPYRTCNIAYRRETLATLGGFDESLRWYADNILGLRAARLGPVSFASKAVVHHPPRARNWRDVDDWRARFAADAAYRNALRGLGITRLPISKPLLPLVLWVARPIVKQSSAHVRYLCAHPREYLTEIQPMLREKQAFLEAWRGHTPTRDSSGPSPSPLALEVPASVIVVTSDREALLAGALESLLNQTYSPVELIVVDHANRKSTRELAMSRHAKYIAAPDVSLAAARQAGVDAASGEIIAFTDDDCLPRPQWLQALVDTFQLQPHLLGVQGRTQSESGPIGSHAIQVSRPDTLYRTCNIAYRRSALLEVGGFDESFECWFEDAALGARVATRGQIGFQPRAIVVHRARPRRVMDRRLWRTLLADEWRLSRGYPNFYRRTRGPGFLTVVIARWMIGSPLKTLWRDLPHALASPKEFAHFVGALARERIELFHALTDFMAGSRAKQLER
jgi:glycosyltransferase involved in cell wall biosynthesis